MKLQRSKVYDPFTASTVHRKIFRTSKQMIQEVPAKNPQAKNPFWQFSAPVSLYFLSHISQQISLEKSIFSNLQGILIYRLVPARLEQDCELRIHCRYRNQKIFFLRVYLLLSAFVLFREFFFLSGIHFQWISQSTPH